jgi:mannose-1-phosphate guanylyltransferase/mannose-6-phosphate isomerase
MNYAIILSGGVGTRFWPLSRQLSPKQFLSICFDKSLIEETINRISPLVENKNIFLAANEMHLKKVKSCITGKNVPWKNFFFEPQGKNTLAPIAVLSHLAYLTDKNAIISVFPSDHYIKDRNKFLKLFTHAIEAAKDGFIVTLGIVPVRPETGYGYIKAGQRQKIKGFGPCYKLQRFIEKPDLKKAKEFVKAGNYYWNGGIFIFKAGVFLDEVKKHMPKTYALIKAMKNKKDCLRLWNKLPNISIDFAVMEKTDRAVVIPASCGWTDLGSWQSMEEIMHKNKDGNIFRGCCVDLGSKDTFVWSNSRLVTTVGLKDIIVVNTKDALLVCAKEKAQDVKSLVTLLKQKNLKAYL